MLLQRLYAGSMIRPHSISSPIITTGSRPRYGPPPTASARTKNAAATPKPTISTSSRPSKCSPLIPRSCPNTRPSEPPTAPLACLRLPLAAHWHDQRQERQQRAREDRDHDIIQYVARGWTDEQIGDRIGLSPRQVNRIVAKRPKGPRPQAEKKLSVEAFAAVFELTRQAEDAIDDGDYTEGKRLNRIAKAATR